MWYRLSGEGIVSATHAYRFACQKLSIIQTLLSDVRATAPDKRHREEAGARWLATSSGESARLRNQVAHLRHISFQDMEDLARTLERRAGPIRRFRRAHCYSLRSNFSHQGSKAPGDDLQRDNPDLTFPLLNVRDVASVHI
jgi:hypothetical protein